MLQSYLKKGRVMEAKIIATAFLKNKKLYDDNAEIIFESTESAFLAAAKELYKFLEIKYPKFHKMDPLSKSAFLCSEYLLKNITMREEFGKRGIFIANQSSSLDTDENYHQKTFLSDGSSDGSIDESIGKITSNPALFVYTLPNIMIGELSIRNQLMGEQFMWVINGFNADYVAKYVNLMFHKEKVNVCIVGWVDFYYLGVVTQSQSRY